LKKAFDCIDYEILIEKLKQLNLNNNQIKFFETYIKNRKQKVNINEVFSETKVCKKGVPQGSILGSDLFKLYINDITKLNLFGNIQLYADDAALKYSVSNENELICVIQEDLQKIDEWLVKHKLCLNLKKTKILIFDNKCFNLNSIIFKNESIEIVATFIYLGLVIDTSLSWFFHIEFIKKKILPYIFILKRLRNYLSLHDLFIIYSSFIKSHLTYLNPIWSSASITLRNSLDILNKKAIKSIHRLPILFPTNKLYNDKYFSFDNICKIEKNILAFKIVNNNLKHNFLLSRNIDIHTHNTRNKENFYLDTFKSRNQEKNCLYDCLKSFNSLDANIKSEQSIIRFKKKIIDLIS